MRLKVSNAADCGGLLVHKMLTLAFVLALASVSHFSFASDIIPLEGDVVSGDVVGINEEGIQIQGGTGPVPLNQVLRIENAAPKKADDGEVGPALFLNSGGNIPFTKVEFNTEEEAFELVAADGSKQNLIIDVVGAVLLQPKVDTVRFNELMEDPTTEFDRILFDVGAEVQVVSGLLVDFGAEKVVIDIDNEEREFPRDKVTGIVLAGIRVVRAENWVEVATVSGSVFQADTVTLESGKLSVDLGSGDPLVLPWSSVATMNFFSPGMTFLSDTEPSAVSTAPIVSLPRKPKMGANVLGGNLVMEGRRFVRGVGMPGGAKVTFSAEGYDRLLATVGIDDITMGKGDCEVVVLGDGKEIFKEQVKGGEAPLKVNVELGGADEVTLQVIPGTDLDLADYVNWGDAVLIRK